MGSTQPPQTTAADQHRTRNHTPPTPARRKHARSGACPCSHARCLVLCTWPQQNFGFALGLFGVARLGRATMPPQPPARVKLAGLAGARGRRAHPPSRPVSTGRRGCRAGAGGRSALVVFFVVHPRPRHHFRAAYCAAWPRNNGRSRRLPAPRRREDGTR